MNFNPIEMKSPENQEGRISDWSHWFEIPVIDFERAKSFYESIFDVKLNVNDFGVFKMGVFPHKYVGCAIVKGEEYQPGTCGVLVYFDANPDLSAVLDKVEGLGGEILHPKKQISPEQGYMAVFRDSEGNRVALRSVK